MYWLTYWQTGRQRQTDRQTVKDRARKMWRTFYFHHFITSSGWKICRNISDIFPAILYSDRYFVVAHVNYYKPQVCWTTSGWCCIGTIPIRYWSYCVSNPFISMRSISVLKFQIIVRHWHCVLRICVHFVIVQCTLHLLQLSDSHAGHQGIWSISYSLNLVWHLCFNVEN